MEPGQSKVQTIFLGKTKMKCEVCGHINGKSPRTTKQNRSYFGIVVKMIGDHLGYYKEEMHHALAAHFLGYEEIKIDDEVIKVPKSTKLLSTVEFNEYVERVQRWAAEEHSIVIPDPR